MLEFEKKYWENGCNYIAGIDEVGRGPLCGPVIAAAVIFPKELEIDGINDSKKLSPKKREKLFNQIKGHALSIGIGIVHEDRIDDINILEATKEAMIIAVRKLDFKPDILLVDGNISTLTDINQENIIKGDQKSQSIAAASIIAKVTRDQIMTQYDMIFPGYGLSRNMGYGTKEHMNAIKTKSSTPIHRKSFKPIKDYMPSFKDISDVAKLSIQLAACKMIQSGHKIIDICSNNLQFIDILSEFNNKFYAFKLHSSENGLDGIKNKMQREGNDFLFNSGIKKDITSSLNMSVISVRFSRTRPKIIFKKL